MSDPTPKWTEEELNSDSVSKKDLVTYLQDIASIKFQQERKLKGQLKNISKTKGKDALIADYKALFETKAFKQEGEDEAAAAEAAQKAADAEAKRVEDLTKKTEALNVTATKEAPKYVKTIQKKGSGHLVHKGDTVACYYTGRLANGTVFDTNAEKNKKGSYRGQPLRFKAGMGKVIKGWDECLLTMSAGEVVKLEIEPEWAYGRKGVEGKIPKDSKLFFDLELISVD